MDSHLLKDVLEAAYEDAEDVTKSLDDYLADALMLHDWLVERDQPPPSGWYTLYDDNAVELAYCPDELNDIVEGLVGVLAGHLNRDHDWVEDDNPVVNFTWDLSNRRIVFTPDRYQEEDHETDQVSLSHEKLVDLNSELQRRQIHSVDIIFNGSGDEGYVEDPEYNLEDDNEDGVDSGFDDYLRDLVEGAIDYNWYDNDGGHGNVTFTARPGEDEAKFSFDAYYRSTDASPDDNSTACLTY